MAKNVKIWFCEDTDHSNTHQHGYGKSKRSAEFYVADNRGYATFSHCLKDGWAKPAVQIIVPSGVAGTLLQSCKE